TGKPKRNRVAVVAVFETLQTVPSCAMHTCFTLFFMRIRPQLFGHTRLMVVIAIAAVFGVLFSISGVQALAQNRANNTRQPSFEVASVKVNNSSLPPGGFHLFGGRFNATQSAAGLIQIAYGSNGISLNREQVSGGPEWMRSRIFEIDAKVDDALVQGEWRKLS